MVTIFAALAAAWLTGMIPLAVFDICHPNPQRETFAWRLAVMWLWPLGLLIAPDAFAYFWRNVVLDRRPNFWTADPAAAWERMTGEQPAEGLF